MVSDLVRRRPLWFGGVDRSEQRMDLFYQWLAAKKAASLYDKLHVMRHLGQALDTVRKQEYKRLTEKDRSFIKGQKDTLLSRKKYLTLEGRKALNKLLGANKRLHTASLLKESFGQLWEYQTEG